MTEIGLATERLKGFVERIETLETEKAALGADITEIYAEAKSTGLNPKAMRQVIKLRKLDRDSRNEMEHLVDLYMTALEKEYG